MKKMLSILVIAITLSANAQWSSDPTVNNPVNTITGPQWDPEIISDGAANGSIAVWDDLRSGTESDIYVQRLDAEGVVQWNANGVVICNATNDQILPQIVSDGVGGAIITWSDFRSGGDIYAQRVNGNGAVQWTTNGMVICNAPGNQSNPAIVSDFAGGAIITWQDLRNGTDNDIYAQQINASGIVQWAANGISICNLPGHQLEPQSVSDGLGGSIITWEDERNGNNNSDIYAQRIDTSGVVQWTTNGVLLCNATDNQFIPKISIDGAGGAIITWTDLRNGSQNWDIYAQLINKSGVVQWTTNGVIICNEPNSQLVPKITTDGAGGAIISWQDLRNTIDDDIYMQRVDASGIVQWTENGIVISSAAGSQGNIRIVPDGNDGTILVWSDLIVIGPLTTKGNAATGNVDGNIYAQRVNNNGVILWKVNGVEVCSAAGNQFSPAIKLNPLLDGVTIVWSDDRNQSTTSADIYAQKVNTDGSLGNITSVDEVNLPTEFHLEQNYPNPFNPTTKIKYIISSVGTLLVTSVQLKVYDVLGKEVATLVDNEKHAGNYEVNFDAAGLASGVYFYKLQAGGFIETKKMILLR